MSKRAQVYSVENCFMFDEEEQPRRTKNLKNSTSVNCPRIMEFRADKPYRLALYVQPSLKRKLDPANPTILANMSEMKRNRDKENVNKCKPIKKPKVPKGNVNVALFDEESVTSNKSETSKRLLVQKNTNVKEQASKSTNRSILSYVQKIESPQKGSSNDTDLKLIPKTKQKKMRRSYEKKCKGYHENENIAEPSSDQILKEIDIKKINKSKIKKQSKEEMEFEQWAENMNSAFDDIDKFELSINYD